MTNDEKLMQQALEALENGKRVRNGEGGTKYQPDLEDVAITALQKRLAQPSKPLTEESVMKMAHAVGLNLEPTRNMLVEVRGQHAQLINLTRAIEAAHGIKGERK